MKNRMRRPAAFLLALCMVFGMVSASALAAEASADSQGLTDFSACSSLDRLLEKAEAALAAGAEPADVGESMYDRAEAAGFLEELICAAENIAGEKNNSDYKKLKNGKWKKVQSNNEEYDFVSGAEVCVAKKMIRRWKIYGKWFVKLDYLWWKIISKIRKK